MKKFLNLLVDVSFFLLMTILVVAYVLPTSGLGELLSHFLVLYSFSCAVYVVIYAFLKRKIFFSAACILCALTTWGWVSCFLPASKVAHTGEGEEISLYALNIWFKIDNTQKVLHQIKEKNYPQIVLLQEVTPELIEELSPLKEIYPYVFKAPQGGAYGMVLFSKLPIVSARRVPFECTKNHYTLLEFLTPRHKIPFVVVELHASSPGGDVEMTKRRQELEEIGQVISRLPYEHKILVGDLNTTPYSSYFKKLLMQDKMKNAMEGFRFQGTWPTYLPSFLRIPLDHVLVTPSLCVRQQEVCSCVGSDHSPVLTHMTIPKKKKIL